MWGRNVKVRDFSKQMSNLKNVTRAILFLIGIVFVCLAVSLSNASYSEFFAKDLSWGTNLFRGLLIFHGITLIAVGLFWRTGKSSETTGKKQTSRSIWIALIILTCIALGLRLWNLNSDLWVDEVFTLLDFVRPPMGEIVTSFPSQNQHLLYSITAHASLGIFGETAWALRLPAVLFGVLSIPALFFLCRKILGSTTAILAAALMTVSYHHIWFSQNARGYSGLLFFTLLATWFWFEALDKNSWNWWLLYAAAIVFGMWIHLTMAFVVAAHTLVHLILLAAPKLSGDKSFSPERKAGIKPFVAWFLSVTVTFQIYALALPEFLRVGLHEESRNSEWTNPIWVLTETLQNLSIGFAGIAVVFIGAAFVAFGWFSLFRKNRRAAFLMMLPPIFAGSLMLGLGHNLFPRFFFFAMGFALIIVVHGAIELPRFTSKYIGASVKIKSQTSRIINHRRAVRAGFAFVLLIIAASIITVPRNYALPKQDFSGAKNYVENNRLPNEEIVAVSIAGEMYGKYFAPEWLTAKTIEDLYNIERKNENIWLIYTLAPEIKAFRPEVWTAIQRDYKTVEIFPGTLNGGEIFVCRKRNTNEEQYESSRNFKQR
jgi:mannosyltransferase